MASAAAKNFAGLLVARFILGLFEACIFAGFGLVISAYWTKKEQTWRTAVIFSTLSSVVNGLLSYAAAHYHGSLGQWQVLFLSVGGLTLFWSILCWLFLAGTPLEARWMSAREKVIAVRRTAQNRTGVANRVSHSRFNGCNLSIDRCPALRQTFKKSQIYEAFLDPKSWLIFCINLVLNIPNNGVLTFNR